jgi:hypothetical protein
MAREFPNATWEITNRLTNQVRKSKKYVHLIAHYPCERCNNGWMHELEDAASPILIPLIHGNPALLSVRDQVAIRTWFLMKAFMYDLHSEKQKPHPRRPDTNKPRPRYFQDDEHRALMSALFVHPAYMVFIGRYKGNRRSVIQEDHSGVSVGDRNDLKPLANPVRGYALTFMIEHLVLQSFCAKVDPSLPFYVLDFFQFCTRIGGSPNTVKFPALFDFDDTFLDKFIYRWSENPPSPPT